MSKPLKTLQTIANTVSTFPQSFPIHIRKKILYNTHQANEILQFGIQNPQYLPANLSSKALYKHPLSPPALSTAHSPSTPQLNNASALIQLHDQSPKITHLASNVFSTLQYSITKCPNKDANLHKLFRPSDFLAGTGAMSRKIKHSTTNSARSHTGSKLSPASRSKPHEDNSSILEQSVEVTPSDR